MREIIKHASLMQNMPESWPDMQYENGFIIGGHVGGVYDCPEELKKVVFTQENIIEHEWNDSEDLEYMIDLFRSKAFKRSRGDYK